MKEIFADGLNFKVGGRIWISSEYDFFLGPGRIELLEKINEFGSISKAAAAMGMSYKKAWDLVASMNHQAKHLLVATQAGGKKGGGAHLSDYALQAINNFKALQSRFEKFLQEETIQLYTLKK